MTKNFLSRDDAETLAYDIMKTINRFLDDNYVLEDKEEKKKKEVKEKKEVEPKNNFCKSCNKNSGRLRASTKDYRCRNCGVVFKNG